MPSSKTLVSAVVLFSVLGTALGACVVRTRQPVYYQSRPGYVAPAARPVYVAPPPPRRTVIIYR